MYTCAPSGQSEAALGHIVFLGPPGSGKGTQCRRLGEQFGIPHLSTGELLREIISQNTALSRWIAHRLDDGNFAPDHFVLQMVAEWIAVRAESGTCLFDGFPRTLAQSRELDRSFDFREPIDVCILLTLSQSELEQRLRHRATAENRADDSDAAIAHRMRVFESVTLPIAEYYEASGRLLRVDGSGEIGLVSRRIATALRER